MCYNGKCMHCINVETGSLVFAIISVLLTGAGCLLTIGITVYFNMVLVTGEARIGVPQTLVIGFGANVGLGIILCILLPAFSFSVVLIKGIVEKKPGHVKAYFIYGVLVDCLIVAAVILGPLSGYTLGLSGILFLCGCAVYALILKMIYMTYQKYNAGVIIPFAHNKLVEEKDYLP